MPNASEYQALRVWHRDSGSNADYIANLQRQAAAAGAPLSTLYRDIEDTWVTVFDLSAEHPFRRRLAELDIGDPSWWSVQPGEKAGVITYADTHAPSIVALNAEARRIGPNFPIGARLRSYDFDSRRDCYVEGKLTSYRWIDDCNRYCIKVDKVVFDGTDQGLHLTRSAWVYPPCNGTLRSTGGVCTGVERVD